MGRIDWSDSLRRKIGALGWVASLALAWSATAWGADSTLEATIVDRHGNHHEVQKLVLQGRLQIEYYVGTDRRLVPLADVARLRFEGQSRDEELTVVVSLRSGRQETGSVTTGGSVPHDDAVGGGGGGLRFSGSTSLGPFFISVAEVREVIFASDGAAPAEAEPRLRATVITVDGAVAEVEDVRVRGQRRLNYYLGPRKRFVDLEKVSLLDFPEGTANEEMRPLDISLWSGRTVTGTVEAGTVRLAGETDRAYYDRVQAAITGRTSSGGSFNIGFHAVKQVRFHPQEEPQESGAEEPEAPSPSGP